MLNLGIDVGSTTVKIVFTDESGNLLHKSYERHLAKPREILSKRLRQLPNDILTADIKLAITGSAGLGIAEQCGFSFVQEVFATSNLIQTFRPNTNAVIELGGEDAKIIFFDGAVEERMNSTCAGGTGAFIDQMAALLDVTAQELDQLSLNADTVYPIASRCGVFAKTDIQPLINQGAKKENIAASIFQAVVDQTIAGLAQGRPIFGNVMFLGGPLTFFKGLQNAFSRTLKNVTPIFPEHGEYFVAFGAAFYASCCENKYELSKVIELLSRDAASENYDVVPPLFKDISEYKAFLSRHNEAFVRESCHSGKGAPAYLGIDAGSTTTKIVLLDAEGGLLFSDYRSNKGNPVEIVKTQLQNMYESHPDVCIMSSAVTGYGEELIKNAFGLDVGVVETVAHYNAARYFVPNVDFIIDIGGQDMKCFGIKDGMVNRVIINEACSSGCGSFIESFASSMGYTATEFSKLALQSEKPVDLGSRCTVFMNSSVKQALKNGAGIADISAGLAISVVKNALHKVLRISDAKELGHNIVVQGGTFLNDAVLRAFEQHINAQVTRPNIAGLMGAFGAALTAMKQTVVKSSLIARNKLAEFVHSSRVARCGICQNRCSITINEFSNGIKYLSGNRCERPTGLARADNLPNLFSFKQNYLATFAEHKDSSITIGLPLVLNFYDTLPFWFTVFKELGFSVLVSKPSTRDTYRMGQHTIPSDTVCYGAKLVHGHILALDAAGVDAIFYPRMSYNLREGPADNNFHCPVVAYYPEVIHGNIRSLEESKLLYPFIAINDLDLMAKQLLDELHPLNLQLKQLDIKKACVLGKVAQADYRKAVYNEGRRALMFAAQNELKTIVLAGRPYHIDPEINHGIDRLISSLGFVVVSEDAIPQWQIIGNKDTEKLNVLSQWSYHSRMYNAAEAVCDLRNTELVQLVSFGCGLDAITSDEIQDVLMEHQKLYTQLKIDDVNNLAAVKIRMRSLLAAMEEREALKHNERQLPNIFGRNEDYAYNPDSNDAQSPLYLGL